MIKVINKSAHLLIIALAHLLINTSIFAQAPQKMSYQAVIRNSGGVLVTSTSVGMKISIIQASFTVYSETQTAITNVNGLVSLEIGGGTVVLGSFATINWAYGPYFIKTETDPTGGTNYTISGTSELLSVPYALFSVNGTPGPAGADGDNGLDGATGPQGPQGNDGAQGLQGIQGPAGADGATGPQGPAGNDGAQGPQGIQGVAGNDGAQGPQGLQGIQGPAGNDGAQGPQGIQGVAGNDGAAGPQGPAGNDGAQGPQGLQGPAGADGATGPQGPVGNDGAQGLQGPAGNDGINGINGVDGINGIDGINGTNGNGIASTTDNGNGTFTFNYTDGSTFTTSNLTGPMGAQGPAGADGVNGLDGATGPMGAQGIQGPVGPLVSGTNNQTLRHDGTDWVANSVLTNDGTNISVSGNTTVNAAGITGQGLVLSDDGDFVDLNDGFGTMRFSSGLQITDANKGGNSIITLGSNGVITANQFTKSGGTSSQYLMADGSTSSGPSGLVTAAGLSSNYIPKFDGGSSSLVNSSISEDGTALYVGNPNGGGGIYSGLNSDNNTRLMVNGGRELESIKMSFNGDPYNTELSFNWYSSAWRMRTERNSGDITDLSFWRTAGGSTTEAMRLTSEGKLGIGTNSPSEKLDIAGNVSANGYKIPGGTSSQFLKADGSVDANTYLTTSGTATNVSGIVEIANGGTGSSSQNFVDLTNNQTIQGVKIFTGKTVVGASSPTSTSAVLEANSTTQGFLPPRMTFAQRQAIQSPVSGLIVYCTNCGPSGQPQYYDGSAWVNMIGGTAIEEWIPLVGASFRGGKIAYVFQPGDPGYDANVPHGLISATEDVSINGQRAAVSWGCLNNPPQQNDIPQLSGALGTAIGTGSQNTIDILAGCSEENIAAKLAADFTSGGYSDWFLPSSVELEKLHTVRTIIGGFEDLLWYWSSTQIGSAASAFWFGVGAAGPIDKFDLRAVRPIRYF